MASAPYWKLRRLAARAKRVFGRRAAQDSAIAAYEPTLGPKVDAYVAAYDLATRYRASWHKEMDEGRGAVVSLLRSMRAWAPLLVRDVPGFDPSGFGDKPKVPDDVMSDGERLVSTIEDFTDAQGNPLPYRDKAIEALTGVLVAAQKEWAEAEAADSQYQGMLKDVRDKGATFDTELQLFRRTLMAVVGRSDKDFQKLRSERAANPDEDDDPAGPPPSTPIRPAGPDEGPPEIP